MFTIQDAQWLAGIIDSEGSFSMRRTKSSFTYRLRIATTDQYIIPHAANLLKCNITIKKPSGQARKKALKITLSAIKCKQLITQILPYLYTKKDQAECILKAIKIKNGISKPYADEERKLWYYYRNQLKNYNAVGKIRMVRSGPVDHIFSWPWLAGFIDGDGSIYLLKNTIKGRKITKPVLTISSSHLATINYISQYLMITNNNSSNKGNRSPHRKLRLTSKKIIEFGPLILPYLVLKQNKLQKAIDIIKARQQYNFELANELLSKWI